MIDSAPSSGHSRMWLCRCICGKEITARNDKLVNGKKKSCGCMNERKGILPGTRYGKLVLIDKQGNNCLCRCDCGREKMVLYSNLITGNTKSCGCMKKSAIIEPGCRFGRLVVIEKAEPKLYINPKGQRIKRPRWLCRCDCGTEKTILQTALVSGSTQSCGCLKGRKHGNASPKAYIHTDV